MGAVLSKVLAKERRSCKRSSSTCKRGNTFSAIIIIIMLLWSYMAHKEYSYVFDFHYSFLLLMKFLFNIYWKGLTFQCISRKSFWMKKGLPYICMGTYIYKCCKPTSGLKVWRFKVCFEFICRSTTEHKYKLLYCFKLRSCSTTQSSNWHTNCNNVCLYSHLEGQLIHMDL